MPSLAQLEEFKTSFKDVGNEASIMSKNPALIEDFELPEDDPLSPFPDELAGGPLSEIEQTLRVSDLGLDLPPESFGGDNSSDSDFDFGDLLGGDLDNVSPPESGEHGDFESSGLPEFGETESKIPDSESSFGDSVDASETAFGDSFDPPDTESPAAELPGMDMPDDLLSGFSADLESGGLPIDEEVSSDLPDFAEPTAESAAPPETSGGVAAGSDTGDSSGVEFPGIDLSEAVDMGGESLLSPAESTETEESPVDSAFPDVENNVPDTDNGFSDIESDLPDMDNGLPAIEDSFPGIDRDSPNIDANFSEPEAGSTDGDSIDLGELPEAIALPEETAPSDEEDDGFDLGDLPDFGEAGTDAGFPDMDTSFPGIDLDSGVLPETEFSADSSLGDLDIDNLGPENPDAGDFDSAGFGEDLGGETLNADSGADTDTFPDLPETSAADEAGTEGTDAFDNFTAGDDWSIPDTPLETPDFTEASADDELGDFSLSGLDDLDEKGKPGTAAVSMVEFPGAISREEVEEIHLGEDEFRRLQDTLSSYPLNLRVACEELIVEEAVAPEQMSALIKLLIRGAPAKETAALAGKILGRTIPIPRGYAKQTGAELEAEQASLGYIFTKRFLPVLRLAGAVLLVTASLGYLIWRFAVVPLQAESLYKDGYALISGGEYAQANERFRQGFEKHRVKKWFYRYAEVFRDERQYIYAEQKYDELLRVYPRDKKGALDYAAMETNVIRNYEKADRIIRTNILDYAVNDREGLLALAETNLAWGETDPSRYEEARGAYARLMERYGRKDPYLEGMLKYFIRTDNLGEVLPLQAHFMSNPKKRTISVSTLAELGGYLLDKRFEETGGVPEEYVDKIEGIRDVLIRAIEADRTYPESYYHLARYNFRYGLDAEERRSLQDAIRAFSGAREETPKRTTYHIDARRRYGEVLIMAREFFPAEEELIRGVRLYEDARARGVIKDPRPEFGRLYANLGDLEFFVKSGDMDAALRFYEEAERNNWAPPEIQYRMGAAHYQNGDFEEALRRFFTLSSVMPNNRRLLYALGNAAYLRGNYFAAQGYYNRLMDLLDAERVRFPNITPGGRPEEQDIAERIMVADNNLGVTLEALTRVSGDTGYRTRALYLFSESIRAWDVLTRDPDNMTRMQPIEDLYSPGINLAYLNAQNILHASPSYEQQIFMRIDKDCLEQSDWEALVPRDYRLSDQLSMNVE